MSKGKALSPDAARVQAAPQSSHRGRTERQAKLNTILSDIHQGSFPGPPQLLVPVGPRRSPLGAEVPRFFKTRSASAVSRCGNTSPPNQHHVIKKEESVIDPLWLPSFLFASLTFPLSLPKGSGEGRADGCSLELSIQRQAGLGPPRRPARPLLLGRVGTEGCFPAFLPTPILNTPFLPPLPGPPSPSWPRKHRGPAFFQHPLPCWFGVLPRAPDEYSAFVIASSRLVFI